MRRLCPKCREKVLAFLAELEAARVVVRKWRGQEGLSEGVGVAIFRLKRHLGLIPNEKRKKRASDLPPSLP